MRRVILLLFCVFYTISVNSQNFEKINISANIESPNMIETIDFDGDGLDDFLLAGSEKFYWYENQGNAEFIKHSLVDSIQGFWRFSLYDWENDGDLDIFFTTFTYGSQRVAWLENDGSQSFTYHLINDTIINPYYVKAIDLDNDNDVDILVSSSDTDELYWLKNDGSSNYTMEIVGNYVNSFEIADLNGDNDWDIIFGRAYTGTTYSEVRAFQNDGNNNFSMIVLKSGFSVVHEVIVEDINGDNYFDIVAPDYSGDAIKWLKNDGNYNFSNQSIIINNFDGPEGIDVKDVNEDGRKDIIAGSYQTGEIYYFQGTGSQSSYSFSNGILISNSLTSVSDLAIGNFDNQDNLDFIHCNKSADEISVWTNDGSQNFTEEKLAFSFDSPRAFDMQDLDGDGDQDLAAVSNDGDMVAWMENTGDDIFKTHILITNYEEPYVVRINDLDDDGDFDIIAASNDDDRVSWWENDGSGNFTLQHITTNVNGPRDLWIEDYDGDGDKDIAVICYWLYNIIGNTGAQWLKNDGNENFTLHEIDEDVRAGRSMRGADMNGDNLIDIVMSSYYYTGSKLRIAVNTGSGFGIATVDNLLCEDFEICDFDGDQDNDILAIDFSLDSLYFYENIGSWQFNRHTLAYIPDLYGIAPRDYDGDGDMDVVFSTGYSGFTNSSHFEWGLFRNDGAGNLSTEIWEQNLSMIKPMEVFDYENDGDYDIILGFDYADKIVLQKNLEIDCHLSVDINATGNTEFCEGGSVQLQAITNDTAISYQWYNDTIAMINDTLAMITVDTSGLYRVEVSDTSCSVFSGIIKVIENPVYSEEFYVNICKGETIHIDTTTISSSGDYTFNLQSQWGCDSVVTLHVFVADTHRIIFDQSICSSEFYDFNGTLVNQSGTYYDTLQNINACDSILQLNLTVYPEHQIQIDASICDGDVYDFNGTILDQPGTYYDTLQTLNACDSIVELSLTVYPVFTTPISAAICDGDVYDFNGTILDQPGTYYDTLQTVNACDSIVELSLNVYPVFTTPISASICVGDIYDFNGTILDQPGTYYDTLQTLNACDSIVELSLTVYPVFTTPISAVICGGDIYDFNGTILDQPGTYYDTLQTLNACDSIVELSLTVYPVFTTPISAGICAGDIYDFNGTILDQPGTYYDSLKTVNACDSIVELSLTVYPVFTTPISAGICAGDVYDFNGTILDQPGTYFDTLQTLNACDSIVELSLTVYPVFTTPISAGICAGEVYDFNGTILDQPGTYFDSLQTVNGCDSIVELSLTVYPAFTTPINAGICAGDVYDFNGTILDQTGTYYDSLLTVNGCDSVIVLDLIVNPLPMPYLGNDTTINDTASLVLDPGSFLTYLWQDGSTNPTYNVNGILLGDGTFTFSVMVTDINSCINNDTIEVIIQKTVGISDVEIENIMIYPNPVRSTLYIKSGANKDIGIKLYNSIGSMVFETTLQKTKSEIDMSAVKPGKYFLLINIDDKIKVVTIIKL
jgi:hypothetical protein